MVIINYIKKAYQYIFYKLYRFCESMPSPWWSETKAMVIIDVLIVFTIIALAGYYRFFNRNVDLLSNKPVNITIYIIVFVLNYFIFNYNNKWKEIIKGFDNLPKKKNRIGSFLVFLFILFLFANFIFSMYLGGTVDWSQYR